MKLIYSAIFVILVLSLILISGCSQLMGQPKVQAQGGCRGDWTLTKGCVYACSGYVINSGTASANNVEIEIILQNANTGAIRDSKTIQIGTLDSGVSKNWDTLLDGECDQTYKTDLKILQV